MTEFMMLAAAVAVGYFIAGVIVIAIMMNSFVMKMLMKWSYNVTMKAMKELEEEEIENALKENEA